MPGLLIDGFQERHPMVRVEWEDSCGVGHWLDLEKMQQLTPMKMVTYGCLVRDDAECVMVVGSRDTRDKPDVDGGQVIPRSAVRKVDYLVTFEEANRGAGTENEGHPEPSEKPLTHRDLLGVEVPPSYEKGGTLWIDGEPYTLTPVRDGHPEPGDAGTEPGDGDARVSFTDKVVREVGRGWGTVVPEPPVPLEGAEGVMHRIESARAPSVEPEPDSVATGKRGFFSFLPWAGG